jgi:hypothetical protein
MRAGPNFSAIGFRLSTLIILSIGCLDGTGPAEPSVPLAPAAPPAAAPPAPEPMAPPPAPPAFPAPPDFPPLSRAGIIYRAPDSVYPFELFGNVHGSSIASRYVLYDDDKFGLQFASANYPFVELTGHYSGVDSVLTFTLDGDNNFDWGATGTLRGDSLIVKYNLDASMSDFMDGVYVRSPDQ